MTSSSSEHTNLACRLIPNFVGCPNRQFSSLLLRSLADFNSVFGVKNFKNEIKKFLGNMTITNFLLFDFLQRSLRSADDSHKRNGRIRNSQPVSRMRRSMCECWDSSRGVSRWSLFWDIRAAYQGQLTRCYHFVQNTWMIRWWSEVRYTSEPRFDHLVRSWWPRPGFA